MEISKKMYKDLSPKQRAIATYAGFTRSDWGEVDRLIGNAKKEDYRYRQAMLGLQQALTVYNFFISKATIDYLSSDKAAMAVTCFCDGWLAAGGSSDNKEYIMLTMLCEISTTVRTGRARAIKDIQNAAREWCEKNQVPVEFFSKIHCPVPLPNEIIEKSESETFKLMRTLLDSIKLAW